MGTSVKHIARSRNRNKVIAIVLGITICPAFFGVVGQNAPPVKTSLWGTGGPQFPTGYWFSDSDPHFRHRFDRLFWLDTTHVASSFFRGFCCRTGDGRGVKYRAVIFDSNGTRIATHDWTATPNAPFSVLGMAGSFWLRYEDHIEALKDDFTVAGQIPLGVDSLPRWSNTDDWVAVIKDANVSIYHKGMTSASSSVLLPARTRLVDLNDHAMLVSSASSKSCYTAVFPIAGGPIWTLDNSPASESTECEEGQALISEDAVLVSNYRAERLEIVHRGGSAEVVSGLGHLIGLAKSGRLAVQTFQPSRLAQALDMDFGGQKDVSVYDRVKRNVIFHKTIGGQAGAALAPDGHHLAIIEGKSLLIYSVP
jgi:hypothetical protein